MPPLQCRNEILTVSGDIKELNFVFWLRLCGLREWDLNQRLNMLLKCGLWELYHSNFYWVFFGGEHLMNGFIFMELHDRVIESLPSESQLSCMVGSCLWALSLVCGEAETL